jgi:hypothetical protein
VKPSKEAVERAAKELWYMATYGLPWDDADEFSRSRYMAFAQSAISAAIVAGSCCHRECEWGPDEILVNQARFGLIPIE